MKTSSLAIYVLAVLLITMTILFFAMVNLYEGEREKVVEFREGILTRCDSWECHSFLTSEYNFPTGIEGYKLSQRLLQQRLTTQYWRVKEEPKTTLDPKFLAAANTSSKKNHTFTIRYDPNPITLVTITDPDNVTGNFNVTLNKDHCKQTKPFFYECEGRTS